MSKIYKILLAILIVSIANFSAFAQDGYWASRSDNSGFEKHKAVARLAFPKEFKLFDLNIEPLRQQLFSIVGANASKRSTIITLPGADGKMEQFEVFEASNFEPALQARFPQIRAYSGRGITDRYATLKISISPQGIQTMVFRTDKDNEFIEPYSADGKIYAAYRSTREKGKLPWTCTTQDQQIAAGINSQLGNVNRIESNAGELKTMRLAQSCNGEYANWFGASTTGTPADEAIVLAAFNGTLTRCNGCYEKDLALHLNLIPTTTQVIFYNPATDPYTTMGQWNLQLQQTLTSVIGNANYDIGHMFGASGGGGNAGCIGCVCVDPPTPTSLAKGAGITSPADGIPMGDNFDIDYVAHEVGHQLGGNHTFSMSIEAGGANNVEVGSGITIMGYAGITAQDVAPHSIDIFHERSIQQIQNNLATKTCPITTNITANNATPVVAPVSNYTIPMQTPFALTGSATDANGDPLTYCWEQNDNANSTVTGNNSVAFPAKLVGPNWLSLPATASPTRYMPRLSTILAGLQITPPFPGGDAVANIEALSSVGRTLNFRLTVRDNSPYSSTPPVKVGQTQFTDMTVTVVTSSGPFQVTSPNTAVSWAGGTTQTVTWDVNNTTAAPVSCANVNILISTDGGNNFSMLVANTPNDGSENVTVPVVTTATARIKVEAVGNIFFDISNANFTITPPPNGFTFSSPAPVVSACPAGATMQANLTATYFGTFTGDINLTATVNPAGPTVTFGTNPLTMATPTTTVTLNGTSTLPAGNYVVSVTGTGTGAPTQVRDITFTISPGAGPVINTQPANQVACSGTPASFTVAATGATAYQWQSAPTCGGPFVNIAGATAATLNIASATTNTAYQCVVTGQCGSTTTACATLTVNVAPAVTAHPQNISVCSGSAASFNVTATGSGLIYQWEESTDGGATWNPIAGANAATYTIASTTVGQNNNRYRCVVSGACTPAATSNAAILTVSSSITITTNPVNSTICEGTNTSFTVAASGSGLSYQWQVSTDGGGTFNNVNNGGVYSGATSGTLTITGATPGMNNYRYRCVVSNPPCNPGTSTAATLTVNTFPVITAQPQSATICEGAGNTFSVTATTGVGVLSYQWQVSTDGGTTYNSIAGATNNTLPLTLVTAGANNYRYRVVVTAGCGSVTSNAGVLTVNTYPQLSLTGIPAVVCKSDPAMTLTGSPSNGTFTGTGISGSTFTPSVAGVGAVTVTYSATNAGCTSTQSRVILVNECAERHLTLDKYPAVIVYPTPNNGNFNIRLNTDLYSSISMRIFDSRGSVVQSASFSGLGYGSVIPVSLGSKIQNGVYHIYLYGNDGIKSSKGVSIIVSR